MKTATVFWADGVITEQKVVHETPTQFTTDDLNRVRWSKRTGMRVGAMRFVKARLRSRSWWAPATARLNEQAV